jgi:hypothetical protein
MSTISEYVYSTLSGAAALTALVADRIFPMLAPELTPRPYIVFTKISTVPTETHDSSSAERLDETIVQFMIVAETYTATEDIAAALRNVLEDAGGPVNGSTEISNIRETYESDTELFVTQLDANFFHSS